MEPQPTPQPTPQAMKKSPDQTEGRGLPQCVFRRGASYQVMVGGAYVGSYPTMAEATRARDAYREAHPRKKPGPKPKARGE